MRIVRLHLRAFGPFTDRVLDFGGVASGTAGSGTAGPGTAGGALLISLVVVVLGGLRSVPATLVAALGVGQVQTLGVAVLPAWAPFLLLAAMVVALLVRRMPVASGGPA